MPNNVTSIALCEKDYLQEENIQDSCWSSPEWMLRVTKNLKSYILEFTGRMLYVKVYETMTVHL